MNVLNRRAFLVGSLAFGASALVRSGARASATSARVPIGIQLWTVNDTLKLDPAKTLQQLRKIGYETVESAGFGQLSASAFRRLIDDAGLSCPSAHLDFMSGDPEPALTDGKTLGAHYVVSSILRSGTGPLLEVGPSLARFADRFRTMTLEDAKVTAALANSIGERAKRMGLQYAYHNHFFEFVDQGGSTAYDVLLRECDPDLVKFEIDCGWMAAAGRNPIDYLKSFPGRFPMIHVKDFLPITNGRSTAPGTRAGAPLGHGFIDYRPILAAAKAAGLKYYFAEQEGPFTDSTQLQAAETSFRYLSSLQQ